MTQKRNDSELQLTVIGVRRDGRRRYDPQAKRALVDAALQPGVSLAGLALKHGINANLLRKWVVRHQRAGRRPPTNHRGRHRRQRHPLRWCGQHPPASRRTCPTASYSNSRAASTMPPWYRQ
jgi:transposase-like protein